MTTVEAQEIIYLAETFKELADSPRLAEYECGEWAVMCKPSRGTVELMKDCGGMSPILMRHAPGKLSIYLHAMLLRTVSNVCELAQCVMRMFRPELVLMKDSGGFVLLENMTGSLMGTFERVAGAMSERWVVNIPLAVRGEAVVLPAQSLTFNDMRGCL